MLSFSAELLSTKAHEYSNPYSSIWDGNRMLFACLRVDFSVALTIGITNNRAQLTKTYVFISLVLISNRYHPFPKNVFCKKKLSLSQIKKLKLKHISFIIHTYIIFAGLHLIQVSVLRINKKII